MKRQYTKWIMFAVAFLSLMTVALPAFAGPFDVPAGDKSKEIFIDTLFGPLTGAGSGSELSNIISVFNQAMLFVGGILVAYTLIAGTMSTAHDGEMLGKRWSSMWVPVRTALGTAAILPVLPGGFCAAQAAVVWLALQGVGLADRLVEGYIGNGSDLVAGNAFYEPPSVQRPIRQLLETMLVSNTCVAALNTSVSQVEGRTVNGFGLDALRAGVTTNATRYVYGLGGVCGSVIIPSTNGTTGKFNGTVFGVTQGSFDVIGYTESLAPVNTAQLASAQAKMQRLGEKIANGSGNDLELAQEVRTTLDSTAKEWSTALYTQAKSSYQSYVATDFLNKIKQDGWLMLGAWYMEIAKVQDAIARGVTSVPNGTTVADESSGVAGNIVSSTIRGWAQSLMSTINGSDVKAAIGRARGFAASTTSTGGAVEDYANANTNTWTAKIVSWFINEDSNLFGENIGSNMNQNPVLMARNLGQNMTLLGWTAYGTSAAAVVLGTQSAAGVGTSGLAAMVSPMITALAGTIIVSGATLSTYIPMLPYILWIGVALGWAVLLVEAVIAAPLWAVTHLAPDGDGVVGRGGQGYMLVLSLVLRPGLMVLGFVSAVILMKPLGLLINSTFMGAFLNGVNPSIFGLSQMIMGCVLYVAVMISVITRVFALIHVIPDKILRWIGGGAADLGETAHGIESHTAAKVMAGAHVGQQLGSGALQGAQGMRSQMLQERGNRENRAGAAAQTLGNAQDRLARNQAEMTAGLDDARNSDSQQDFAINSSRVQASINDNASSALGSAVAAARAAEARGSAPSATDVDRSYAQRAQEFLKDVSAVNPNDSGQAKSFIDSNANNPAYAGTQWGTTMQKSLGDRGHAQNVLASLASSRSAANSPSNPRQPSFGSGGTNVGDNRSAGPRQGNLFDDNGSSPKDPNDVG